MNYPEEKNTYIDGIPCQYLCHVETAKRGCEKRIVPKKERPRVLQ